MPEWPKEYGGGGLSREEAKVLRGEMRRLGCRSPLNSFGIWMLGPALLRYGSEAQKREYLPQIARGEIRWCQGYSEPNAGSDLASLATRAEDRGDHFLVNGQKIWTSYADKADWIFCLVRTDPAASKHPASASFCSTCARPACRPSRSCSFPASRRSARPSSTTCASQRAGRRRTQQGLGSRQVSADARARNDQRASGSARAARWVRSPRTRSAAKHGMLADTLPARRHCALRGRQRGLSVRAGADRRPSQSQAGQSGHLLDAQILRRRTEQAPS